MSSQLHGDVASAIGQQVEQMILQAKKDSEARVKHELGQTRTQLAHMEGLVGELQARIMTCEKKSRGGAIDASQTVDQAFLNTSVAQLEQKWGSEVKALKQDLHRTILAHNHNSDLMRHHRDALDEARRRLDLHAQPKAEQLDAQIEKFDKMLRQGQAKQRALEALTDRMDQLEKQVLPSANVGAGAYPGMLPGMRPMNPLMAQQAALAKKAAAKGQVASAGDGSGFNAEAPVFVPGRGMVLEASYAEGTAGLMGAPGLEDLENDGEEDDDGVEEEAENGEHAELDLPPAAGPPPGL